MLSRSCSCSCWFGAAVPAADYVPKYSWIWRTAIDPSPTAEATRLTEPLRTSPAANTPGWLVSRVPKRVSAPVRDAGGSAEMREVQRGLGDYSLIGRCGPRVDEV